MALSKVLKVFHVKRWPDVICISPIIKKNWEVLIHRSFFYSSYDCAGWGKLLQIGYFLLFVDHSLSLNKFHISL